MCSVVERSGGVDVAWSGGAVRLLLLLRALPWCCSLIDDAQCIDVVSTVAAPLSSSDTACIIEWVVVLYRARYVVLTPSNKYPLISLVISGFRSTNGILGIDLIIFHYLS